VIVGLSRNRTPFTFVAHLNKKIIFTFLLCIEFVGVFAGVFIGAFVGVFVGVFVDEKYFINMTIL